MSINFASNLVFAYISITARKEFAIVVDKIAIFSFLEWILLLCSIHVLYYNLLVLI